jgi:hypothetical protein
MPQRPSLSDLYGGGPKGPSLDELYGGVTAGGFDERELAGLEKEFGLTKPTVTMPEPLATPWDLISRAPKFITEPARKFANNLTDPNSKVGQMIDLAQGVLDPGDALSKVSNLISGQSSDERASLRGFFGGGAEGAAGLASPLNVAATVSGLGAESLAARGLTGAASIARGVNTATAVPSLLHGGKGVIDDPTSAGAWAELGGGALGTYLGLKSGPVSPMTLPERAPRVPVPEQLMPGEQVVHSFSEPPAPAAPRGSAGPLRPGRNINQPLREGISLDELYGPAQPQPMGGAGSLEIAPDVAPAPPMDRFPRGRMVSDAQAAIERGEPANPELSRFFGMTPEPPVGRGMSDVGQMDLGRRPQPGSMLPEERAVSPVSPVSSVSEGSRMPAGTDIQAAQEAIARGEQPPAELRRFFGLDEPPRGAALESVTQPDVMAPSAAVEPPAPSVGRMSLDELRRLLHADDPSVRTPGLTGAKIPADFRNELVNIADEMESRPFVKGESFDTMQDEGGFVTPGSGLRESSDVGGVVYPNNPDHPNLVQHTKGAPVFHDIMQGVSGTRKQVQSGLERILGGGRPTSLTDRAVNVAQRRVADRGPGVLEDVMGNNLLPERAAVEDSMLGGSQPRLPGEVGDVRNVEAQLPPVAELPEQGFNLTAPAETMPTQMRMGELPPPASNAVDPRIKSLYDDLFKQWRVSEAKMASEGNPLVGGDLFESLDEFADRVKTADPRKLMGKERAVRKALDSEGGFLGGDLGIALGSAATGAATGGASDDDHPFAGAVAGGLAGLLLGRAGAKLLNRPGGVPRVPQRPLTVPRENLGGIGSGDALDEAFRITKAGKGGLTPEPIGGKRFHIGDLGSDAGFVEVPSADEFKRGATAIGKATEKLGYFSMLGAPSTIAKGHIGAGSAGVMRALEEIAAGRPGVGGNILKNMGSLKSGRAYRRALTEGSADPTATRWGATEGILGAPSRMMAAPDALVTESMLDAGIPLESAKRSAFTGDPRSLTGQKLLDLQRGLGPIGRTIAFPFARTAINLTERGIERTPGLGLIAEMFAKNPDAMRDVMARQGLGLGAGAIGYSQGEDDGMMNPYALTAMGPYAVPAAIGAALRGFVDHPKSTAGKSAASKALFDVAQGTLNQSPLPTEGYQLDRLVDPRNWPSRYIPRFLSTFSDPNEYATPGLMDPTIARIPFLNDALLARKKKRGRGIHFGQPER